LNGANGIEEKDGELYIYKDKLWVNL
jgi:hypothetical protein